MAAEPEGDLRGEEDQGALGERVGGVSGGEGGGGGREEGSRTKFGGEGRRGQLGG